MSKKIILIACLVVAIGSISAYAVLKTQEPPMDIVQEGMMRTLFPMVSAEMMAESFKKDGVSFENFRVVNNFPREINGEKVMVYETVAFMKSRDPKLSSDITATFGVTKRGNSWYFIR